MIIYKVIYKDIRGKEREICFTCYKKANKYAISNGGIVVVP